MTASNDLVARLRENAQDDLAAADCPHVCREAADRIEALEAALRDARIYVADEAHWARTSARLASEGRHAMPWKERADRTAATLARIDALLGERT